MEGLIRSFCSGILTLEHLGKENGYAVQEITLDADEEAIVRRRVRVSVYACALVYVYV